MSLLRGGQLHRDRSTQLFRNIADIEAREKQTRLGLEAAKDAQEMQTYGTAAGIGAMYGLQNLGANAAPAVGEAFISSAPEVAQFGGETAHLLTEGKLAAMGADAAAGTAAGAGAGAAGAGGAAGGTAAAGTAAGSSTAAAATGVPGTMSSLAGSLGSIAAPIGIALGIGYLLNKLFD